MARPFMRVLCTAHFTLSYKLTSSTQVQSHPSRTHRLDSTSIPHHSFGHSHVAMPGETEPQQRRSMILFQTIPITNSRHLTFVLATGSSYSSFNAPNKYRGCKQFNMTVYNILPYSHKYSVMRYSTILCTSI